MSEYEAEIARLRDEAADLPNGPVRLALLEEAVRLADAGGDADLAYELRDYVVNVATFSGRPDVAIVNFAWRLAHFDRRPDAFDEADILWSYKWIIETAIEFPSIPLAQVQRMYEDMSQRFNAFGTPHAVHSAGRYLMMWTGRHEEAARYDELLFDCERDRLSDCPACLVNKNLGYLLETKQWQKAFDYYDRQVTPATKCLHEPHRILAHALKVFWQLGKSAEAQKLQQRGYKLISRNDAFIEHWGLHIEFLALTNQAQAAKRLLQRHAESALNTPNQLAKFEFVISAHVALERLRREGAKSMRLSLADPPDVASTSKGYDTGALADWFLGQARGIGEKFDRRNGNDFFQRRIGERIADLELAIKRGDHVA